MVACPDVLAQLLKELVQLKGKYKKRTIPPKAATRNTRGPLFFKFVCVNYDKENRRLRIPKNKFAGRVVASDVARFIEDRDKAEYTETVLGIEKEESHMSGEIINQA